MYPQTRLRRLRMHPRLRDLVRETRLAPSDFILPLFVRPGKNQRIPIKSMPGQFQLSVDQLAGEIREIESLGIPAIILFGIPDHKDAHGTGAYADDGIEGNIQTASDRSFACPGATVTYLMLLDRGGRHRDQYGRGNCCPLSARIALARSRR